MPIIRNQTRMICTSRNRKVEISIYSVSNSDRLLRDHKAWGDGDLVDVLSAYDFDSRLDSSMTEFCGNSPVKKGESEPDPYETPYWSNSTNKWWVYQLNVPQGWMSSGLCLSLHSLYQVQAMCSSCKESFERSMRSRTRPGAHLPVSTWRSSVMEKSVRNS